jgi:D-xylose 1-dehydrogenase
MLDYSKHTGYTQYSSLENKAVFITGGATGIGAALVEAFASQKSKVAFVDINADAAVVLCDELEQKGFNRPLFIECDVSNTVRMQDAIARIQKETGEIEVLINNAANDQRYSTATIAEQEWMQSLSINLHPAFFTAQAVMPMMIAAGGGVILNISSINVRFAPENLVSYITAKAGLIGMTKALAKEMGEHNIRVNALLPGWVATPKQLEKWLTSQEEKTLVDRMCIKKRLAAHDVAKLALFLASDDALMITAQEFVVDGGRM